MSTHDPNRLQAERRAKLAQLRQRGDAYPNQFRRDALAGDLHQRYDEQDNQSLLAQAVQVRVAGRLMSKRIMGKASFASLQDMSGRLQLFLQRDHLPDGVYEDFKTWDVGDIIGAVGTLFKTNTGELSVRIEELHLLTKSLQPLPEKFHGLTDQELRYRQRYVDLMMNQDTRRLFQTRTAIVRFLRRFLDQRGFLEVETPMMQVMPGGALARPFETYHHALDMPLYMRIAPELYLKRLVVGGFEQVYEINRNFRNEGLSTRHNPEFTMLEFYQAYADYRDLMDLTETMLRELARDLTGGTVISYQEERYDLATPFQRLTVKEAILRYCPAITAAELNDFDSARKIAEQAGIVLQAGDGLGKIQIELFEKNVEHRLREPTFITAYPTEVSPLARQNDDDPSVVDRFEFFVGGREIANGFSELNDADEQAARFRRQLHNSGEEKTFFDDDYIRALEYGLPPTAGEGIGVDRLVMLFTDAPSIRDVILFPHMRPTADPC